MEVTGSGPPLLLLHGSGGGFDQGTWLAHVLGLSDHHIVSVSRPGYLSTPDLPTLDEGIELFAGVLDGLQMERAVVLGASAGGMSALAFAARHPARVRALVMVSAVSGRVIESGAVGALRAVNATLDMNRALIAALRSPESRPFVGELFSTLSAPERRVRGMLRDLEISAHFDAPRITGIPTLVIHGTSDRFVPFAHARRSAEMCAGATLVPIEGAGHLGCLSHPKMGERVRAFLAAIPRAR